MSSVPIGLASTTDPLAAQFEAVLLDLDGVVYVGADAVEGAAEALRTVAETGCDLAYLTNNASRPARVVAQHLRDLGMPVNGDESVVTSAQAIAHLIADEQEQGARILVVGGAGLRESLTDRGLVAVDSMADGPVAIVQGYDPSIGWEQLAEASYAVQSGLPWYASNTDLTIPTSRGVAPGNGALVETVRIATGAEPKIAGKPHRPLFEETITRLKITRPLMVGDRLDTDIEGARSAGIASLAVLTGVSSLAELFEAPAHQRPDFISSDLHGLNQIHPSVTISGPVATCGSATATVRGQQIDVAGADPRCVDALRAAVQLAWSLIDTSGDSVAPGGTLVA